MVIFPPLLGHCWVPLDRVPLLGAIGCHGKVPLLGAGAIAGAIGCRCWAIAGCHCWVPLPGAVAGCHVVRCHGKVPLLGAIG